MFLSLKSRLSGSFQLVSLLAVLLLSAGAAFGQAHANAADLQGTVTDTAHAVVPNANVTSRNPATNISRNASTNDNGYSRIVPLPPGHDDVPVQAPHFTKPVATEQPPTIG